MKNETQLGGPFSETADFYHEQAGRPEDGKYWSSSYNKSFQDCPRKSQLKIDGKLDEAATESQSFGTAFHTLILEPELFPALYLDDAGAPVNPKTSNSYGRETKTYAEWERAQAPKIILPRREMEMLQAMAANVKAHENATMLLIEPLLESGSVEQVFRANYCGVPCQIRIDFLTGLGDGGAGSIVDLKSCADLSWFENDAKKFGYVLQAAFYQEVYRLATGAETRGPCWLIGVEKQVPYRVGVWEIHEQALAKARLENEGAMELLKECLKFPREISWPTGFESVRQLLIG